MRAIKAVTLTQPWATLMAIQEKTIETRSWYTSYRGPLVIHAAKGFPKWAKEQCLLPRFAESLNGVSPEDLPRSVGVCLVEIVGCIETTRIDRLESLGLRKPPVKELCFGDFSAGRWAWITRFVRRLENQGPINGSLGLWDWHDED